MNPRITKKRNPRCAGKLSPNYELGADSIRHGTRKSPATREPEGVPVDKRNPEAVVDEGEEDTSNREF